MGNNALTIPWENQALLPVEELNKYKEDLIFQLELFLFANKKKVGIEIISDDCFTNFDVINLLKSFLGTALFNRYFEHTYSDPKNGTYNDKLFQKNFNNKIIILGGSFTDINTVDSSIKNGKLFQTLQKILYSDIDDKEYNNFIIGVCYGKHVCDTLMGHKVQPTHDHYKRIKCELTIDEEVPNIYKKMLRGLHNDNTNKYFTASATNRQSVIETDEGIPIHVLAKNEDGGIEISGIKNGKYIGIQHHPELDSTIKEVIDKVHSEIGKWGIESEYLTQPNSLHKNTGEYLYIPILLEAIKKINSRLIDDSVYDPSLKDRLGIDMLTEKSIDILSIEKKNKDTKFNIKKLEQATIGNIIEILKLNTDTNQFKNVGELFKTRDDFFVNHKEFLQDLLFKLQLGSLNGDFNWSVSRILLIISETLGIKDYHTYIHARRDYLIKNGVLSKDDIFTTRELGPGDLTGLMELINKDAGIPNMIYYGVGDKIYYKSLYNILLETFDDIPVQILKVFTHKFFHKFNGLANNYIGSSITSEEHLKKIIIDSINGVEITKEDKVGRLTMFGIDVKDTGYGEFDKLDKESISFLESNHMNNKLEEIKEAFRKNPLKLIDGFFHKMLISQFSDIYESLNKIDPLLAKAYVQFSLRATSHLSSEEYLSLLDTVIENFLGVGGVINDDGVHESFTFIIRTKELLTLKKKYGDGININVIYDSSTNYISSVIIEKNILGATKKFDNESHINDNKIIMSIEEINKSSFFRIENAYREFIYEFFDYDKNVFWNFQSDIYELTKETIKELYNKSNVNNLKEVLIMQLTNIMFSMTKDPIFSPINNNNFTYKDIYCSVNDFLNNSDEISDIFNNDIYIPKGQNIEGNRKK